MTSKTEIRDGMRMDWDVSIAMDDGLVLRADIYRPPKDGQYPVILSYGPYAKGLSFQEGYPDQWQRMAEQHPDVTEGSTNKYQNWEVADPEKWVPDGYACVRVDSRGCGRRLAAHADVGRRAEVPGAVVEQDRHGVAVPVGHGEIERVVGVEPAEGDRHRRDAHRVGAPQVDCYPISRAELAPVVELGDLPGAIARSEVLGGDSRQGRLPRLRAQPAAGSISGAIPRRAV